MAGALGPVVVVQRALSSVAVAVAHRAPLWLMLYSVDDGCS